MIEEVMHVAGKNRPNHQAWRLPNGGPDPGIISLSEVEGSSAKRIPSGDSEFDRVIGGGIVPGSVILLGGEPGIGKSTLLLQIGLSFTGISFYISGEESASQIKLRANRLMRDQEKVFIAQETSLEKVLPAVGAAKPDLLIVDSIQTVYTELNDAFPGSISQIRDSAAVLQRFAKESGIPVILIGHITKDGILAGPKILEHIVDTVLQFEGDRHYHFRMIRTLKNRFGSTEELGIYEMLPSGLRPVLNPSALFLNQGVQGRSGSAIGVTIEGAKSFLIEVQALVSQAVYGTPQRSSTGYDLRRLQMLLAVMEKRCGLFFGQSDVFLNIAGGLRIDDPAMDMAVIMALTSSLEDAPVSERVCFSGEVGLSGEIRKVNRLGQRIQEASRIGFKKMYISKYNLTDSELKDTKLKILPVAHIEQLYQTVFVNRSDEG